MNELQSLDVLHVVLQACSCEGVHAKGSPELGVLSNDTLTCGWEEPGPTVPQPPIAAMQMTQGVCEPLPY